MVKKMAVKESKKEQMKLPSLVEMLEAGVHFGHERSKKNPKMDKNIYMLRNRMAIIDLGKTSDALRAAVNFVQKIAADKNNEILFVGTKRQAREIVKRHAERTGMPYVSKRWLGGTLTNFSTILKSIEKLGELKKTLDNPGAVEKMTKKEKAVHRKEIERLEQVLEGIKDLKKMPAAIIVVGSYDEKIAVREANRVGLPVIGITDTNADPGLIDFPIPANDDAIRAVEIVVDALSRAILTARGQNIEDREKKEVAKESVNKQD